MFSAKWALQLGGFMVCLNGMCYYLFTLQHKVTNVKKKKKPQDYIDTHYLCTYTYVTELTLVLTLWNDCEPSRVCVACFFNARTTPKTISLLWTFIFKWHSVPIAHDGPFGVQQISHEATKFAVYLQLRSSVSTYFTVMILWIKEACSGGSLLTSGKKYLNRVVLMQPILLSA